MLYDDGFLLPGGGNNTVVNTDSVQKTAEIGSLGESPDPHFGALPSDAVSETSMMHDVTQHSYRTHDQAQQAVSSP